MLAALLRRDLRLRCGLHRQPPLSLCCSHAIPRISVSSRSLRSKATQPTRAMSSMFTWRNRTKTPPLVVEDRISLKLAHERDRPGRGTYARYTNARTRLAVEWSG